MISFHYNIEPILDFLILSCDQFLFISEIWGFLSASERRNAILSALVSLHVYALLNEETDAHSFYLEGSIQK